MSTSNIIIKKCDDILTDIQGSSDCHK